MQIIPAIDIIDGKCVRLTEGDYSKKTQYNSTPLEMAKLYQDHGIDRLHIVDLDGAKTGKVVNWNSIEEISSKTDMVIDFGGGVKSAEDVARIIDLGIHFVTIGSMAVKHADIFQDWLKQFGAEKFMLGADVKNGKIMISGWQEESSIDLNSFLDKYFKLGILNVFCTDISKDGKLEGPSFELYKALKINFPQMNIIASGGVSSMDDVYKLQEIKCDGVIIGKAIYENRISLSQLKKFVIEKN
jgi:phosphoribosylformimino-5-aminoimidazole carboxamide ribotide isomerase